MPLPPWWGKRRSTKRGTGVRREGGGEGAKEKERKKGVGMESIPESQCNKKKPKTPMQVKYIVVEMMRKWWWQQQLRP